MTQKDSEDDDGTEPKAAGNWPDHSRVPENDRAPAAGRDEAGAAPGVTPDHVQAEPSLQPVLEHESVEAATPANVDGAELFTGLSEEAASAANIAAAGGLSDPALAANANPSTSDEQDVGPAAAQAFAAGPYRREDATFVSLPVGHNVLQAVEARYASAEEVQPAAAPPLDMLHDNLEDDAGLAAQVVEERGWPPVEATQKLDAGLPLDGPVPEDAARLADTGVLDERLAIQADEDGEHDASAAYARGSWDRPPPLTQTPHWVLRDVEPDIVPPRIEVSEGPVEPVADEAAPFDTTTRAPDVGDSGKPEAEDQAEIASRDAAQLASDVTPAVDDIRPDVEPFQESVAQPPLAKPLANSETSESFAPQPAWRSREMPLPGPAAEVEREEPRLNATPASERTGPAPFTIPAPIGTPDGRGSYQARVEPEWQRPAPPRVLQDSRPGDFARDRFEVPPASDWQRYKDLARKALRYAGYAVGGYFAFVFVLILLYRFVNPPVSSLMLVQALTGTEVQQQWVSLDEISPSLVRAVIVSEDWPFCEHYGIDITAIEQAIEKSGNGIPRGGSTISMQTTKNLFLWNARSYVRKVVEVPLTLLIELVWPKSRILEIYLNVAEWGPGIFGAEAAAQYHFNKSAARLDSREAAQLAASLPNPIIREAGDPGPRTARKASVIQSRMRNAGAAAECVLGGRR